MTWQAVSARPYDWESRVEGERDELFRKTERSEKEARRATDALEAKGNAVQDAADAAAAAHADARSRTSANERQDQVGWLLRTCTRSTLNDLNLLPFLREFG